MVNALKTAPREALFQALTAKHKGDTNSAWNEMLDLATGIVNDRIAFDNLTPEQKEAFMAKRELDDLRQENERLRKSREEEERAAGEMQAYNAQHAEIVSEIETQGYEPDEELILEVAETMALAHDAGYDFVDARRAVRSVIEEHRSREADVAKRLKVEDLPPELVEKVLKASVEKFKKTPQKSQSARRNSSGGDERRSRRVAGLPGRF